MGGWIYHWIYFSLSDAIEWWEKWSNFESIHTIIILRTASSEWTLRPTLKLKLLLHVHCVTRLHALEKGFSCFWVAVCARTAGFLPSNRISLSPEHWVPDTLHTKFTFAPCDYCCCLLSRRVPLIARLMALPSSSSRGYLSSCLVVCV